MLVLGIDPGTAVTGYGVITGEPPGPFSCLEYGTIRSASKAALSQRLKKIYDDVSELLQRYPLDAVALEDVFYGKNIQTAMKLGQARGAVIIAAMNAGVDVATYAARDVKQALTGFGGASKEQVRKRVQDELSLANPISPLDASDALAIAVCHAHRHWTEQKMAL